MKHTYRKQWAALDPYVHSVQYYAAAHPQIVSRSCYVRDFDKFQEAPEEMKGSMGRLWESMEIST